MEKKGSRSVQTLSKGSGTDSKKSQDANKLWPRASRRREPNGGTFPKPEISRKPIPQRNKTIDKRPRPRGGGYHPAAGAVGGNEDAGLGEIEEAEVGSVFVQGSKKQSLNHLLNFHFEPREGHWRSRTTAHLKSGHRFTSTLKHKYNKEQFLQANCQFIVQESGDYKQYMNNADALVNWDLIEEVRIHVWEYPSCPICLFPPVAAKMTRCGHIYCWSCVLHYLALSDKACRKCPICYEAVHKKDLKSVVSIPHTTFNINETITFKLMKRTRDSFIAHPVEEQSIQSDQFLKVSNNNTPSIYSKLLLAGKPEVMSIIERERVELARQLKEEENNPEKCFIDQALILLNEREQTLLSAENGDGNSSPNNNENNSIISRSISTDFKSENIEFGIDTISCVGSNRQRNESVNSDYFGSEDFNSTMDLSATAEDLDITSANTGQTSSKVYYFYQAADGQHIYLHALNIRMLEHTYKFLELCPKEITGRIVEKESISMTEDIRNRLRYLQHLPVTCQFEVAEIHLKSPLVKKETLEKFQDQIDIRRKRRQNRAREEKRREKRILAEENKKMGKFVEANIRLESHYQFPDFQADNLRTDPVLEEENSSPHSERSSSPSNSRNGNVSLPGSLNSENEYSAMSFAKMVSSNKFTPPKKTYTTALPSQVPTSAALNRVHRPSESDAEIEGHVPAPQFNQSFSDAIAIALERAALTNDQDGAKVNGKKKKKKKSTKVLFTTSMSYSGN